jgi:hypothetical protein
MGGADGQQAAEPKSKPHLTSLQLLKKCQDTFQLPNGLFQTYLYLLETIFGHQS